MQECKWCKGGHFGFFHNHLGNSLSQRKLIQCCWVSSFCSGQGSETILIPHALFLHLTAPSLPALQIYFSFGAGLKVLVKVFIKVFHLFHTEPVKFLWRETIIGIYTLVSVKALEPSNLHLLQLWSVNYFLCRTSVSVDWPIERQALKWMVQVDSAGVQPC